MLSANFAAIFASDGMGGWAIESGTVLLHALKEFVRIFAELLGDGDGFDFGHNGMDSIVWGA